MKVYKVTMPYFNGYGEHGYYESPLFETREDAEKFLEVLIEMDNDDLRKWWNAYSSFEDYIKDNAVIQEIEITTFDKHEIEDAPVYLHIF